MIKSGIIRKKTKMAMLLIMGWYHLNNVLLPQKKRLVVMEKLVLWRIQKTIKFMVHINFV